MGPFSIGLDGRDNKMFSNATQKRAAQLDAQRVRDNVDDWFSDKITHETFGTRARQLWRRIEEKGARHAEAVVSLVR